MTKSTHHTDLTYLKNLADGNDELIVEMIGIYKTQIPQFIDLMKKAIDETNWDALAAIAHKAKSSVVFMGISYLAEVLKDMELKANAKTGLDTIKMHVNDFERICTDSIIELDDAITKL